MTTQPDHLEPAYQAALAECGRLVESGATVERFMFWAGVEYGRTRTMTEWQPIESAPTNQSVLVYIPNTEHYGEGIYRAILVDTRPELREPHWTSTALHSGRDILGDYQPTHWMPLPDPPKELK